VVSAASSGRQNEVRWERSLQEQVNFLRDHFGSELRELRLRVTELEKARLCRKEEDIEKSMSMERVGKPLDGGLMSSNYFIDSEIFTLSEKLQQNTFLSGQLHNMNYRPATTEKLLTSPDLKPVLSKKHVESPKFLTFVNANSHVKGTPGLQDHLRG